MTCYITGCDSVGSTKLYNVMHRMGAQVHGLGANEPTCTPLATPLRTTDRYDKEQTLPLASLEALWLAPAPAQQAGLSKRAALSRRSFDQQNASLAVAMV